MVFIAFLLQEEAISGTASPAHFSPGSRVRACRPHPLRDAQQSPIPSPSPAFLSRKTAELFSRAAPQELPPHRLQPPPNRCHLSAKLPQRHARLAVPRPTRLEPGW